MAGTPPMVFAGGGECGGEGEGGGTWGGGVDGGGKLRIYSIPVESSRVGSTPFPPPLEPAKAAYARSFGTSEGWRLEKTSLTPRS